MKKSKGERFVLALGVAVLVVVGVMVIAYTPYVIKHWKVFMPEVITKHLPNPKFVDRTHDLDYQPPLNNWAKHIMLVKEAKQYQYTILQDEMGVLWSCTWLNGVKFNELVIGESVTVYVYKGLWRDKPILQITHAYGTHR